MCEASKHFFVCYIECWLLVILNYIDIAIAAQMTTFKRAIFHFFLKKLSGIPFESPQILYDGSNCSTTFESKTSSHRDLLKVKLVVPIN